MVFGIHFAHGERKICEISSVIQGSDTSQLYPVKGAVDLNHLHADIFFSMSTPYRGRPRTFARGSAANLIRATIRIDESCWTQVKTDSRYRAKLTRQLRDVRLLEISRFVSNRRLVIFTN